MPNSNAKNNGRYVIRIRVKKLPHGPNEYFNDEEYKYNCMRISSDINYIDSCMEEYTKLVFPSAGVGTGLAKLKEKAPETYQFLVDKLNQINIKQI